MPVGGGQFAAEFEADPVAEGGERAGVASSGTRRTASCGRGGWRAARNGTALAVDETAFRRRHQYVTVVSNPVAAYVAAENKR